MMLRWHTSDLQVWQRLLEPLTIAALFAVVASIFLFAGYALLPGPTPLFFPPAGLALTAFMICRWRGFPVVGLGTLAFHLAQSGADDSLPMLCAMTVGPTAQAALAAWLIGRCCGLGTFATPASTQHMRTMAPLRLGARVAVLMTLVTMLAPAIGVSSLLLFGDADRALATIIWQRAWLGSLAGMLCWGPPLFFAALSWRKLPLPPEPIIFCLASLIAGAGLMVFVAIHASDRQSQVDTLNNDVQAIASMTSGLMQTQITEMVALKAFMESSQEVSAKEFDIFATQLLANDPVMRSLSWVANVPAAERDNFERQPPHQSVTSWDLAQDSVRRDLIERARESGKLTASAPLRLYYKDAKWPAVLAALPVYYRTMSVATVSERQQAFKGVVVSLFEPYTQFAEIRAMLSQTNVEFFVFDLEHSSKGTRAQLIAWSSPGARPAPPMDLAPATLRHGLHAESRFSFAGRERLIIVRMDASAKVITPRWDAWLVLVFSWLICATLLYFMGRREAQEESLRQSNDLLHEEAAFTRQLLEQLPIGVAMHNLQGDVIDVNPAFCAMLGRSRTQTRGLRNAQITPPEFIALDAVQIHILESSGAYGPYEKEFLHADGSRVPVLMQGLRTEWRGQPMILSVVKDISAHRKSEFQLAQSQKMDAIGQLTGGLAHDFNNMLGVIIGNLDLLTRSLSGNKVAQVKLDTALTAALRGADLTRALLAVARTQAMCTEPVDLNSRLQELLALVRHTAGKAITVNLKLTGRPVVEIDPGGLAGTVLNLVLNARDAMPGGGDLTLTTELRTIHADDATSTLKPGQYAELRVSDTGSGMRPEVLARVLEPFFTTKERGRGTGLGLPMAHGFVKQCGGDLLISSTPGAGTTLRLILPIAAQPTEVSTEVSTEASTKAATTAPTASTDANAVNEPAPALLPRRSERVLVVDDELDLLAVTAIWLQELGYQVTPCTSPTSALVALKGAAASGRPYALMVTDITMPGMDGFALAGAARAIEPSLSLLYISGFADTASDGLTRPDANLLEKPFRQPALAISVRQAIEHSPKVSP